MQHQKTINSNFRFRRFTRKAYAAFCSLHRIVTIGHLSVDTANCQLRKAAQSLISKNIINVNDRYSYIEEPSEEIPTLEFAHLTPITIANPSKGVAAHAYTIKYHHNTEAVVLSR